MIEIRQLSKRFGSFLAVDNVSFKVDRAEVLGFLGPNGAGKSTTMKMITGFLTPTSGSATVAGHDVSKEPLEVKRRVGYLPEGAPAYPDMTPESFLKFVARVRGIANARARIDQVVALVHLEGVMRQTIETLSKGYKRRVGLAQAILHDPEVLIMDEPTDGLDPNQKHEVRSLISAMSKTKAIVLSTHILEEVEAICTRAVVISRGRLIADGTPLQLRARSRYHNAVSLIIEAAADKAGSIKGELARVAGVSEVESIANVASGRLAFTVIPKHASNVVADVGGLARAKGWAVEELRIEGGRLDEVFRTLTAPAQAAAGGKEAAR